MEFLKSIFSPSVINKTVDAVIDTGDALFYTDEEKAREKQLATETKMKMLKLYEPFKIAQRLIAILFTLNFIAAFWVAAAIYFTTDAKHLKSFIDLVSAFELGWIMIAIISFYFGGGFINSYNSKKSKE